MLKEGKRGVATAQGHVTP